ncbi:hypothetical protein [Halogeometricum borinquense]|uniref:hypothetical protein n=1 Tax=Halogeometricum borinquense TaxID=60847 RepID=UPI001F4C8BE0|nr:hypothetical protein [Halogeometricum borinquense]
MRETADRADIPLCEKAEGAVRYLVLRAHLLDESEIRESVYDDASGVFGHIRLTCNCLGRPRCIEERAQDTAPTRGPQQEILFHRQ